MKISAVVNTYNSDKKLSITLKSLQNNVDEIVVADMGSTDKTLEIAQKYQAKIVKVKRFDFVEPARNQAIKSALGDWILIVDSDEEISKTLIKRLRKIAEQGKVEVVKIPRKNIIFNQWIKHTRFWPDYQIRFFKTGYVNWLNQIHSEPKTKGKVLKLPAEEKYSLIHYHYDSIEEFIQRLNRYTSISAQQTEEYVFPQEVIQASANEFFNRFFMSKGYEDANRGLSLSVLQAFSEAIVKIKILEKNHFNSSFDHQELIKVINKLIKDWQFWLLDYRQKTTRNLFKKLWLALRKRLIK